MSARRTIAKLAPAFALFAVAAASLTACSHPEVKPDKPPEAPKAESLDKPALEKAQVEKAATEYKAQGQSELDKALERLRDVRVFFEFDAATLTKDATARLAEVGEVLARHPELDVNIQGHADERGSSQYNLALGQKRAESVKKYLAQLGVKEGQIKAVSFGAEKPLDPGHDEEAWKKNRRAEVQTTPDAGVKPEPKQPVAPPKPAAAPK